MLSAMNFPPKNISLLPHEFPQKLDLEQEGQDIDKFLEDDETIHPNLDTSAGFSTKPSPLLSGLSNNTDEDFIDFSKKYNTTGQYADIYKTNQINPQETSISQEFQTPMSQLNSWELPKAEMSIQEEILSQLKTNNLYIRQLTEQLQQSEPGHQGNLPEEIIAELKTNNLYLSRVELKISQLLRALERLFKA